jgi:hypothetical protein
MNFNIITIQLETKGTIIITPEHFYNISDHTVKYVVMYSLKYININPDIPEIIANIPYYISDGGTNKLRANMLYPFMCYSTIDEISNCPYDVNRSSIRNRSIYSSLLLKYSIDNNINIDKLEEDLLHTFLSIYPDLQDEGRNLHDKIKKKNSEKNVNLISVLPRITNLIDFIICITNDAIRDFDYTSQQTQTDIDHGKYAPLPDRLKITHDYIDLSIFSPEIEDNSSFDRHFRLVILTILNKYYNLFIHSHLCNIQPIHLESEIITYSIFNSIVNICQKETAKMNMKNYKIISNIFMNIIIEKIDTTHRISDQDRTIIRSILIHTAQSEIIEDEIYDNSLKKWNSQCLSKGITIHTRNVFTMSVKEICEELSTYTPFLRISAPMLIQEIDKNCNDDTCEKNPKLRLNILIDKLLMVRSLIISYFYIGKLNIIYKTPDNTVKTILVDIDSSETIATLKSKIFNKIGIEPSHQHLMIKMPYVPIVHLENDRTIASYNIRNNTELTLSIQ